MTRWIREADFVLMICTEIYFNRVQNNVPPDEGRGVKWEGSLIRGALYQNGGKPGKKFIPINPSTGDRMRFVPEIVDQATIYKLLGEYDKLLRRLEGRGATAPGSLGPTAAPAITRQWGGLISSGPRRLVE